MSARPPRPLFFRLALILFPLGIIVGVLIALFLYVAKSDDKDQPSGRGQALSEQRIDDIRLKLKQIDALPADERGPALEAFLMGTLGSPANAGLSAHRLKLEDEEMSGTWMSFEKYGSGRRAGLTLFVALPPTESASDIDRARLSCVLNALESLVAAPDLKRDVTLIFHPPGDPLALPSDTMETIQRRLDLTRGGEFFRVQFSPIRLEDSEIPSNPTLIILRGAPGGDLIEPTTYLRNWIQEHAGTP